MKEKKRINTISKIHISVCEPTIGKRELDNVATCIKNNWISSQGEFISKFEEGFTNYCNSKYGVVTTSGTSALHLALVALGIKKGDEVIVPAFTMIATVFAICYTGAKPVLVDVEPETGNIDVEAIAKKVTRRTKVIMPVHIYGHPCDMDPILKISKKKKIYVVEDAAEAHGAEYKGKKVGSIGDLACFSFYANKIITTGEGGMVITNNGKMAKRLRLLKNLSFVKRRFIHYDIGYNYRMTNIQAALGLAQLQSIDKFIKLRRQHALYYNSLLKGVEWIITPVEKSYAKNVYWMYGIRLCGRCRNRKQQLMDFLKKNGIETRSYFFGMHKQPVFRKMGLFRNEVYPVTDELAKNGLYLPSGSSLKKWEIEAVVKRIKLFK